MSVRRSITHYLEKAQSSENGLTAIPNKKPKSVPGPKILEAGLQKYHFHHHFDKDAASTNLVF